MCVGASTHHPCRRFCSMCGLYGTSRPGTVNAFPPSHSFTVQWQRMRKTSVIPSCARSRSKSPGPTAHAHGTAFVGRLRCPSVCIYVNRILCTTPASSTSRPTTPETAPRHAQVEVPEGRRGRINSYICLRCPGRGRHCRTVGATASLIRTHSVCLKRA